MKDNQFDGEILIIGGAGYIGSHVNKHLHKNGYSTVVLDDLSRGSEKSLKWGHFYRGDFSDTILLDEIFNRHKISAVMHFAALAYVGESVQKPSQYYQNNVVKTLILLNTMLKHQVLSFIFSSSCATFGEANYLPIDEMHTQNPINPYGRTKLMVEQILLDFDIAYGLKSCIFRYFNAAGCDPEGEIGENHDPETHLIPLVLKNLTGDRPNLKVFGTDYETKDGTCIRDYIHVNDIAKAHRLGMELLNETRESQVFNLGNGGGYSILDVLKIAEMVSGLKVTVEFESRRKGDPAVLVGSSKKAKEILDWVPEIPSLEDMIRTAWNWEKNR